MFCCSHDLDWSLFGVKNNRSQLDLMRFTCDQLRLNTRSPDRDDKVRRTSVEGREDKDRDEVVTRASVEGRDDEESRVLKEKMAEMLSDEFVTVEPRKHSIFKHLRLLVDSVRRHNLVGTRWHRKTEANLWYRLAQK